MKRTLGERLSLLIPKSRFFRSVGVLVGGTAAGQVLVFVSAPLLTRLYSPEDFGVLAVFVSLLSMLTVVCAARYPLAIPIAENASQVASLVVMSLGIVAVTSLGTGAAVSLVGEQVSEWLRTPKLSQYVWLLPLSLVGAGTYQVLSYWAIRDQLYAHLARTKLSQGIGMVATQVGAGLIASGPIGLLLGDVVGRSSGSVTLALRLRQRLSESADMITWKRIAYVAKKYRKFPLLSSGSALLNSAGLQATPLMLATLYGPSAVGSFALTQRVVGAPMLLIGTSVAQVYLGQLAETLRSDPLLAKTLFRKIAIRLFAFGSIPLLVLGIIAPWAFALVFGETWLQAGRFARLLAIMFAVQFVAVPLSQTLNALERQGTQLAWDICRFLLVVGTLGAAHFLSLEPESAVAALSAAMAVTYAGLLYLSWSALRSNTLS